MEKNNTTEEKPLCLYRQVFKVVKIASCHVRTRQRKKLEKAFKYTHESCENKRGSICFWITSTLPNIDCHQEVLTSLKFCSKFRRCRHCSSFCWCLIQNSSKADSVSCNWAKSLKTQTNKSKKNRTVRMGVATFKDSTPFHTEEVSSKHYFPEKKKIYIKLNTGNFEHCMEFFSRITLM